MNKLSATLVIFLSFLFACKKECAYKEYGKLKVNNTRTYDIYVEKEDAANLMWVSSNSWSISEEILEGCQKFYITNLNTHTKDSITACIEGCKQITATY